MIEDVRKQVGDEKANDGRLRNITIFPNLQFND